MKQGKDERRDPESERDRYMMRHELSMLRLLVEKYPERARKFLGERAAKPSENRLTARGD